MYRFPACTFVRHRLHGVNVSAAALFQYKVAAECHTTIPRQVISCCFFPRLLSSCTALPALLVINCDDEAHPCERDLLPSCIINACLLSVMHENGSQSRCHSESAAVCVVIKPAMHALITSSLASNCMLMYVYSYLSENTIACMPTWSLNDCNWLPLFTENTFHCSVMDHPEVVIGSDLTDFYSVLDCC